MNRGSLVLEVKEDERERVRERERERRGAQARRYISYARGEVRRRSGGELSSTAKAAQGVVLSLYFAFVCFLILFCCSSDAALGAGTGCSCRNDLLSFQGKGLFSLPLRKDYLGVCVWKSGHCHLRIFPRVIIVCK